MSTETLRAQRGALKFIKEVKENQERIDNYEG